MAKGNQHMIIITRTKTQAIPLAKKLMQLGESTQVIPMLAINPMTHLAKQHPGADQYIFISQNSVEHFVQHYNTLPTGEIIAIGPATAAKLKQQQNITVTTPTTFNTEGLLALPSLNP